MKKLMRLVVACSLGSLVASCGGEEWDTSEMGVEDPRIAGLRRRLDVRVSGEYMTPDAFVTFIFGNCPAPGWTASACNTPAIDAARDLCVAETLLRVSESVEQETVGNGFVVPPQDAETNAELARLARESAFSAFSRTMGALSGTGCTAAEMDLSVGPGATVTTLKRGANLAAMARESYA